MHATHEENWHFSKHFSLQFRFVASLAYDKVVGKSPTDPVRHDLSIFDMRLDKHDCHAMLAQQKNRKIAEILISARHSI